MPLEIGLWRVTDKAVQLAPEKMPLESRLERLILDDPAILEAELLVIGNQVQTVHGKFIDILAIDVDGKVYVIELKKDRTPRDVVAQGLDYASWVSGLSYEQIRSTFSEHNPGTDFDTAFADRFGGTPTPDSLNVEHEIIIVASDLDDSTERIVKYLSSNYSVPIKVMLFRYFSDNGNDYLARTWLNRPANETGQGGPGRNSTQAAWNGADWYVAFGTESARRVWEDARKYGFVSAGGGDWYSRSLRKLPEGARIFVHIPGSGYVGVGTVAGPAQPATTARITFEGTDVQFRTLELQGTYGLDSGSLSQDGVDTNEYVVPVRWINTVSPAQAFWRKGLFANQNSACKLRHELTLSEVTKAFNLDGLT